LRILAGRRFCQNTISQNIVTRESNWRRIAVRPWHKSIVAWGLIAKRTFGTGCSEFNPDHRPRFRATMSRAKSREIGMIEATKRGASEALAQMLAMTAMLVIASVAFYWYTP
jgi:hypothetical protein